MKRATYSELLNRLWEAASKLRQKGYHTDYIVLLGIHWERVMNERKDQRYV